MDASFKLCDQADGKVGTLVPFNFSSLWVKDVLMTLEVQCTQLVPYSYPIHFSSPSYFLIFRGRKLQYLVLGKLGYFLWVSKIEKSLTCDLASEKISEKETSLILKLKIKIISWAELKEIKEIIYCADL